MSKSGLKGARAVGRAIANAAAGLASTLATAGKSLSGANYNAGQVALRMMRLAANVAKSIGSTSLHSARVNPAKGKGNNPGSGGSGSGWLWVAAAAAYALTRKRG